MVDVVIVPSRNPFADNEDDAKSNVSAPDTTSLVPASIDIVINHPYLAAATDTAENLEIYHKIHFADRWLGLTIILHIVQFAILLAVGHRALNNTALAIVVIIAIIVPILLISCRAMIKKTSTPIKAWAYARKRTPDDEADYVSNKVIYLLGFICLLEGLAFAIYPTATVGTSKSHLAEAGFYSFPTMVQTLRFASLTFYALHRLLRPANRLDPLRTMMEVNLAYSYVPLINLCLCLYG